MAECQNQQNRLSLLFHVGTICAWLFGNSGHRAVFLLLLIGGSQEVIRSRWTNVSPHYSAIWDFLGSLFFTSPTNAAVWEARPDHMAWVSAGQTPVFPSEETAFQMITATNFN